MDISCPVAIPDNAPTAPPPQVPHVVVIIVIIHGAGRAGADPAVGRVRASGAPFLVVTMFFARVFFLFF